jgi:dipeptidyl aminopeptidase/acylaminoacyl peptidase
MRVDTLERVPTRPIPWRTIGLLAVIALLGAALVVTTVGSGPRRPAPFGLAANGLVAYEQAGGIFSMDPSTGEQVGLATGPQGAHDPRWSLDGTRLAFIRRTGGMTEEIVIIETVGDAPRIVISQPLMDVDSDGLEWAPDGRSLLIVHGVGARKLGLMDVDNGEVMNLPIPEYSTLEAFFRPPDGREIVFLSGSDAERGIAIVTLEGLGIREVPLQPGEVGELRPMGWTPDGSRIVLNRTSPEDGLDRTYLVDPETGDAARLDVAFGHVSNDGQRVAGLRPPDWDRVCVVDIGGGPCVVVGDETTVPFGFTGKGLMWTPDDQWLVVQPRDTDTTALIDPDGQATSAPDHLPDAIESWQRRAP